MKKNSYFTFFKLFTVFFIASAWFLVPTQKVAAQDSPLRLGLKINPIVSMVRLTDEDKNVLDNVDKKSRIGFSGGLMLDYNFSEKAGLYTGLNIVSRGYKVGSKNLSSDSIPVPVNLEQTVAFTTLEIPLQLKMHSGDIAEGLRIRGLFGAALGFNVAAKTTSLVNGRDKQITKKMEGYNVFTPDFVAGLGVEYDLQDIGKIDVGISYHYGLTRLTTKKAGQGRAFLNYLGIDLGFYF
jgi:hypothetical protein